VARCATRLRWYTHPSAVGVWLRPDGGTPQFCSVGTTRFVPYSRPLCSTAAETYHRSRGSTSRNYRKYRKPPGSTYPAGGRTGRT
jgi:hypothetical protein